MANHFRCSIVTPSQSVLAADATYVSFQAWDGQLGVMSGASPFLTKLATGTVRIDLADGGTKTFIVDSGFAKMQANELTLLADLAESPESLDASTAERDLVDANARAIEPGHTSDADRARLERAQQFAMTKARLARR